MKTGLADLPLHWGKAPKWLFERMKELGKEICVILIDEYGKYKIGRYYSDYVSLFIFKSNLYSYLIVFASVDSVILSISSFLKSFLWGCGSLALISIIGIVSTLIRWSSVLFLVLNGFGLRGIVFWLDHRRLVVADAFSVKVNSALKLQF